MPENAILKVGSMLNSQLSLPLRLRDDASFSNFFVSDPAAILVQQLQTTAIGTGEAFIYVWGACGVGRTHLLQAACHAAQASMLTAMYLPLAENLPTEVLQGMEEINLVCIDDIEAIAGHPAWEEALFHFYNRARQAGTHLIVASLTAPLNLNINLPDLRSRLASGLSFHLVELSDAEKIAALQMRAELRGMSLSPEVGEFLLRHGDRNMAALIGYLDSLDEASLAAQRRLTVPFVKGILHL